MTTGELDFKYDAGDGYVAHLRNGLRDITEGLAMWRTWLPLAVRDFRNQTKRTFLGPLWSILGTLLTVGALGHVYGALLKTSQEIYPFIAAGLIAWFFIAGCLQGGLSVFLNAAGLLKEREMPLFFSVCRYTCRMFIELCFKLVVFAIVAAAVGLAPTRSLLLLVPGLLLLLVNGLWVNLLFGVGGARYRDLSELMSPLMLIAFLATPVLWPQAALQSSQLVAELNPFTHYIAIIREPLLGHPPSATSLAVVGCLTVAGWLLAVPVFAAVKNRVVYWL